MTGLASLAGKVAVVTGAASGIGRGLADRFLAEGAAVVLADVDARELRATATQLADRYDAARVHTRPTDVRHAAELDALAAETFDRFGTAHVICNNAGVGSGGSAWDVPAAEWQWVVDVNLMGVVHGVRAFVPRFVEQGCGHVVNTASAAGLLAGPGMAPYFATKHAVVALSESLHLDLANAGASVGVSVLCPEWVRDTRIHDARRNLPSPGQGNEAGPKAAGSPVVDGILRALVNGGLAVESVAAQTVTAVRDNRFWVLPHRESTLAAARVRWAAIEGDVAPPSWDFGAPNHAAARREGARRGRRRRDTQAPTG